MQVVSVFTVAYEFMASSLPLAGLNIVITRPREQAVELALRIEQLGANALLFPLLEIEPVRDEQRLREQISRLKQADIAIFISPNAVRHGMAAIEAAGGIPSAVRVAAVGQASAQALSTLSMAGVIAPTQRFDSEAVLALAEMQSVAGKRVMIFRGDGGRELLGDTLTARGARVEYVACYLRRKPDMNVSRMIAAAPSAISVTSSEALNHLWDMPGDTERTALAGMPLFVPHQRIATLAVQQGWHNVVVTGSGDDGLLSGLVAWADTKRK